MSLKAKIKDELVTAMKSRNADRLECLRFIQAQVKNKEIEIRPTEVTDEDVLQIIKKLVKQRKEGAEQFQSAGRMDLVDKENKELEILESFLPEQLGEDQVKALVDEVAESLQATSMKDMGKVMKEVLAKSQGSADSKMVSTLVKARLQ